MGAIPILLNHNQDHSLEHYSKEELKKMLESLKNEQEKAYSDFIYQSIQKNIDEAERIINSKSEEFEERLYDKLCEAAYRKSPKDAKEAILKIIKEDIKEYYELNIDVNGLWDYIVTIKYCFQNKQRGCKFIIRNH